MANLYQKLLTIQNAVLGLSKDKSGNSYQYVSGDKLLGVIRPKMDSLGLLLIPEILDSTFTRQDYTLYKNGNPTQKTEIFCALKIKFTWVDTESGEKLECLWASSGQNNFDKSLGSAITYGERYFLLKFFHVPTDKDDVDYPKSIEEEMNVQQWVDYILAIPTQEELTKVWTENQNFIKSEKKVKAAFAKRQKEINETAR